MNCRITEVIITVLVGAFKSCSVSLTVRQTDRQTEGRTDGHRHKQFLRWTDKESGSKHKLFLVSMVENKEKQKIFTF